MIVSLLVVSWNWLGGRFNSAAPPQSETDLMGTALAAYQRGDLNTTVLLARDILADQPQHIEATMLLAQALIYRSYSDYNQEADRQSALELMVEAANHSPNNQQIQAMYAYALLSANQPVTAAQIAQRVLEREPENALARAALGLSYAAVGSFEIGLRESLQAAQNPDWRVESLRAVAISHSDLGDYRQAITAIEEAIRHNTRLLPLHFERALYALQIGDADAATAAYFQVLVYDPENVKARLRLCELSSLMREREAAVQYCTQVTERAPEWSDGWYQLGREYFLQGQFKEAQTSFNRCASLQVMQDVPISQRRFECWYLQGQAAEILGDCENLVATYNEFLAMVIESPIQQTWIYPPEGPPGCTAMIQNDA